MLIIMLRAKLSFIFLLEPPRAPSFLRAPTLQYFFSHSTYHLLSYIYKFLILFIFHLPLLGSLALHSSRRHHS